MKRKILLLGENNSIWTKRCMEHSGIIGNSDIYLVCTDTSEYDSSYRKKGVRVCIIKHNRLFDRIPKVRGLVKILEYLSCVNRLRKKIGSFDVVHASFITREKMLAIRLVRKYAGKIVCTFWGSDLFRVPDKQLRRYKRSLEQADVIMLSTDEMRKKFISVFGRSLCDRMLKLKFGVTMLEYIEPDDTANARALSNIPENKTVITVGYNGKDCQNHIKVIKALHKLSRAQRKRLFLLLPVTYGLTPGYRSRLVSSLGELGCGYRLIEEYLDDEQLARLRESSDVFIHAQTTDAFSASVQEYLYARKLVFNPVWIQYRDMKDKGIYFKEYKDYDELIRLLSEYLENGISEEERQRLIRNSGIIWKLSSWGALSSGWKGLYNVGK